MDYINSKLGLINYSPLLSLGELSTLTASFLLFSMLMFFALSFFAALHPSKRKIFIVIQVITPLSTLGALIVTMLLVAVSLKGYGEGLILWLAFMGLLALISGVLGFLFRFSSESLKKLMVSESTLLYLFIALFIFSLVFFWLQAKALIRVAYPILSNIIQYS